MVLTFESFSINSLQCLAEEHDMFVAVLDRLH
jgi:hypothetical protein